jgi:cytochrome P450
VCIGKTFAMIEATLVTALMSRSFVYDLKPGHPVVPEATLTLRPRYGLKMIARRRRADATAMSAAA